MKTNPYMMMMEADPGRYIQKPAPTLLMLSKTAESVFVLLALFRVAGFLLHAMGARPIAQLLSFSLSGWTLQAAMGLHAALGPSLFLLAALCVVIALVCSVAETIGLWMLRFALAGAQLLKQVQRVLIFDMVFLLLTTLSGLGLRVFHYLTTELNTNPTFAALRTILIAGSVSVVVLTLLTLYHKDVLTVFSVIEYELRVRFKETVFEAPRLGQYSFLFGALSTAAAVFAARTSGFQSPLFVLTVSQAVKYFAVNSSWAGFLRCHR